MALDCLYTFSKASTEQTALLFIDNVAVLFALRKGHSGNMIADGWLRQFYRCMSPSFKFFVAHVSSEENIADKFSRRVPFYDPDGKSNLLWIAPRSMMVRG